jgi:hypothetical protein
MELTQGFCTKFKPTIWHRLGFGECSAPRPDSEETLEGYAPSWFIVGTRIHLGWQDRLRMLITGNLMVECAVKTDVAISKSKASSAVSVLPPFHDGEL